MPIPAILAALPALAQLAPSIVPLFTRSETAAKAAEVVSTVAKTVTGADSDEAALEALKANPALLVEYQRQVDSQALAMYEAETRRLEAVNATIRAEVASGDPYVRRWRPHFGYVASYAWAAQTGAIVLAIAGATAAALLGHTAAATAIMTGVADLMGALTVMWSVVLAVLGVSVWKRSQDKAGAAGASLPSLLEALPFPVPGRKPR